MTQIFFYLQKKYDWPSLHAGLLDPIVQGYDQSSETVQGITELLFGRRLVQTLPDLRRIDKEGPLQPSPPIQAKVIGGSFLQVADSVGLPWKLETEGKILFLEMSRGEPGLMQAYFDNMRVAGLFEGVVAIIFGDFMEVPFDPQPALIDWVLERFANETSIKCPVFRLQGIGHNVTNIPLPLNTLGQIQWKEGNVYSFVVENVP
jgi:muramoyltetrapeptide carboxypeptidase